ncbi:MAG: ABC transporter permease [Acidobacteria bacterium]|nr:ABC transporter permease [Acidobacteriota bacterium]
MQHLIVANIKERPIRALTSVAGVAVGVVLILVTVGLARGILRDTAQREKNVGAELIFQSSSGFGPGVSGPLMSLPLAYCERLSRIAGVQSVTPVGRYLRSGAGGIGFEFIEGVSDRAGPGYVAYAEITRVSVVEGHPIAADDEIMIDHRLAKDRKWAPGSAVELFDRRFRVAGIYEPEMGSRTKMRLSVLQELLVARGKCSYILVKCVDPNEQDIVARRILEDLPGNAVARTSDIPNFYDQGIPSLNIFLRVVVGLATVISALVILLAMYTTVTERTREIGILKSMGASKRFIVAVIEKEALYLSSIGLATGIGAAMLVQELISRFTSLIVEFEVKWMLISALVSLLGGILGALYPALRAARYDAAKALMEE